VSLKTLESILAGIDVPAGGTGGGMQPLHTAAAAADAMLRSLDPYGLSAARHGAAPKAEGAETGVVLGRHGGYAVVAGTDPGTPAYVTSLTEGDRILAIGDHEVTAGDRLDELAAMLRGPADEKVSLRVLRADGKSTATVEVGRGDHTTEVLARVMTGKIAYIRIAEVNSSTLAAYRLQVGKLAGEKIIGVVLDLRAAHGGEPADAATLCAPFMAPGTLGTVLHADGKKDTVKGTTQVSIDRKVVALVGPSTTGAAEFAAGALRAGRRAVLLGAATQGRAPAYRHLQQAGVHLTLPEATIQLEAGKRLTGLGLTPDIQVAPEAIPNKLAENFAGQREAFAKGVKWEPPKKESETDKQLDAALEAEDGDEPQEEPKEEEEEPAEEPAEDEEEASAAPQDPFHDYPLVKRYDPRLVRAVHLLIAADIFYVQAR
jgi:C-terminal peptidase prc